MSRLKSISSLTMSDATRQLNPHLFAMRAGGEAPPAAALATPGRRLRQSAEPLMNKLEERLFAHLRELYPDVTIRAQAKRYRLANGLWYKPDMTAIIGGREYAWEAKGPHAFRGGFENLKFAAKEYTEVSWFLMWEESGLWRQQRVLP